MQLRFICGFTDLPYPRELNTVLVSRFARQMSQLLVKGLSSLRMILGHKH